MKRRFRITILIRITAVFLLLGVVVLTANMILYNGFSNNLRANKEVEEIYTPSIETINHMITMIKDSKMLIQNWVFVDKSTTSPDKERLIKLHEETYPQLKKDIIYLVEKWQTEESNLYFDITSSIDSLFIKHEEIMDKLDEFEDYNDLFVIVPIQMQVSGQGDIITHTERVLLNLNKLSYLQNDYIRKYNSELEITFLKYQKYMLWIPIIIIILLLITAITIFNSLIKPINKIKDILNLMGSGVLPEVKEESRADEIGEMSIALNQLVEGLKTTSGFALKIGEGEFQTAYQPLSDEDVLGNSLLLMRQNLINANNEAELRKIENLQRSWSSQGIAEFGELLRNNSENLEELASSVIFKLVRYLDACIGGLFILNNENEEDKHLYLAAFYAYDRHKFIQKRIEIGENLVGQCFQENETVYLTDVPEDYVHIVSGLGDDNPKSILIVPLKVNEQTFGVVEIASFKNIEPYQVEFVEKIGETIASSISSVKINLKTSKLLAESHEKSERLAKQEEAVRKNISEMEATIKKLDEDFKNEKDKSVKLEKDQIANINRYEQRLKENDLELKKYSYNLNNLFLAVNNSFGYYEFDAISQYTNVNGTFLKMTELAKIDIIGKKHQQFAAKELLNTGIYDKIWESMKNGKHFASLNKYIFNGQTKVFYETFTPIKDNENNLAKVIVISIDESLQKKQQAY